MTTISVGDRDASETLKVLEDPYCRVDDVQPKCMRRYHTMLAERLNAKEAALGVSATSWKEFVTDDGKAYYYNKESKVTQWVPPDDETVAGLLTADEAHEAVLQCNQEQARQEFLEANQDKITTVQSNIRA